MCLCVLFSPLQRVAEELINFLRTHQDAIQKGGGPTGTMFHLVQRHHNHVAPLSSISEKLVSSPEPGRSRVPEPKGYGTAVEKKLTPCMAFCEVAVQVLSAYMSVMGSDFSLEYSCGPLDQFTMVRRVNGHVLATLLLPLCIRMGSGQPGMYHFLSPKCSLFSHHHLHFPYLFEVFSNFLVTLLFLIVFCHKFVCCGSWSCRRH